MSKLDDFISVLSPKWAAKRTAYRQAYDSLKSGSDGAEDFRRRRGYYDAGDHRRLNANWIAVNSSGEFTDRGSRDLIRARARDLERNSDMMNSVISAWVRNIIGGGRKLQAQVKDGGELNDEIEKLWIRWCKPRNCDVTGTQSFNQILRTAIRRKKIDGGVLFLKRYTAVGVVPFQLQMLEVDELDALATAPKHKGNKVVDGIEFNAENRPVGFFIRKYTLDGIELLNDPVYVDAESVLFYFSKTRYSQIREMPEVAPVMSRIRDTNEFINSVAVKQRIEACLSVFVKRALPLGGGISGRSNKPSTDGRLSYNGKMLTPGMITELNAGDEVQVVNPTGQAADAASFIKQHQRLIGAGSGLSYEATSRDMSQSTYSSARQSIIEDGETFAEDNEMIEQLMDEIYETFIISAVLSGVLKIPDFWKRKDDYFEHSWVKVPKPWIDPAKETTANKTALEIGQKTFKDIAAESGKDWRKSIDDMAEVQEYASSKGVRLGGVYDESQSADDGSDADS